MLHTNNMNKCKVKEVVRMLKDDFEESARLHIQGCIADGDTFPEYLAAGDYDICYDLDAAALIRNAGHTLRCRLSAVHLELIRNNSRIMPTVLSVPVLLSLKG